MKVIVGTPQNKIVTVDTQQTAEVLSVGIQGPTGPQGPSGVTTLSGASDVDTSVITDGSVLVYKESTSKWTSTTQLNQQFMDAGEF